DVLQTTELLQILQAEISDIRRAAKGMTFYRIFDFDILIITDSETYERYHCNISLTSWRENGRSFRSGTLRASVDCLFLHSVEVAVARKRRKDLQGSKLSTVSLGALVSFVRGSGWLEPA
ncbi:hypothetical protein EVAR_73663_1, partial [Eumeta japonica]